MKSLQSQIAAAKTRGDPHVDITLPERRITSQQAPQTPLLDIEDELAGTNYTLELITPLLVRIKFEKWLNTPLYYLSCLYGAKKALYG